MSSVDLAAKTAFYGMMVCWWLFALTFWLRKRPPRAQAAKRDPGSYLGLLLQGVAYFAVWWFPLQERQFSLIARSALWSWVIALVALAIAAASVWLVNAAARRLGKQWSLGARIVKDHVLIEDGPYRYVRNPIYTGMLGMLIATGLASTRWSGLVLGIFLFAVGTYIRIQSEERLLRDTFGVQFDEYARRVPALIPGIY